MTLLQRFPLLLFQPDYATSDLYHDPPIVDAFYVVTAYALISALNALLGIFVATGSISASIFTVIGTFALVYITWVILTLVFHFVADLLGGLGELHNTVSYVGLAAAPNVVVATLSLLISIVRLVFLPEDPGSILATVNLGFSLIGMAWGWPGVLCYFGMKNAERVHPIKAIVVVLPVFFIFAALEIYNSNLFDL
ncbi:MAG TPA: YIP1 family protein [Bacteroidota bacterium]|nr:YIP1 family protein [Bacteroidota bacterium]